MKPTEKQKVYTGTHDEWATVHQPWELRYHQGRNFRWPGHEAQWDGQWQEVFNFAGLNPNSFSPNDVLLDVGCGSRPVLDYFHTGKKVFIDPLLGSYVKIPAMAPHWQTHAAESLHALPAETRIPELEGTCDFVLCWNVLDHSFDPAAIIQNIHAYARPGASILIGTDLHEKAHLGHPGIKSRREFMELIKGLFTERARAARSSFRCCRDIAFLLQKG